MGARAERKVADLRHALQLRPSPGDHLQAAEIHGAMAVAEFRFFKLDPILIAGHLDVDDFQVAQPVLLEMTAAEGNAPTGFRTLHFHHAGFNHAAGDVGILAPVSPADGGIRDFERIRLELTEAAEEDLGDVRGGFVVIGPGTEVEIHPGNRDDPGFPNAQKPVEQTHLAAQVADFEIVKKCSLSALGGKSGDFKLALDALEATELELLGGEALFHLALKLLAKTRGIRTLYQEDPETNTYQGKEDRHAECHPQQMEERAPLHAAARHGIADLEPKALIRHPLAEAFVEILQLLGLHDSDGFAARRVKPAPHG
jgi:hypothetical protein